MISTLDIREKFLNFFNKKNHLIMPSSSLVPAGDPTLLLTTAGMVQFKPYFLGEISPPDKRITSIQKCFRTTDIDTVGDHKHLTFFEMLGNFSIGDYFKKEAISYAWEFITETLGLNPNKLYVTVYFEDEEAINLWLELTSIPKERIYRYGKSDNWWGPPGDEGPCGPCSEIHYDFGENLGCSNLLSPNDLNQQITDPDRIVGCHPNCDNCERFVELWNLVFMQFYQDLAGLLTDLPTPNIDTGMGLERAAVICQNVNNVFETDLFKPIISQFCSTNGLHYGSDNKTDQAIRVVVEHSRGAAFLVNDGVVPGNDGRGYVLRRLIRRAARYGKSIGLSGSFISDTSDTMIKHMGKTYPELLANQQIISDIINAEEQQFGRILEQGLEIVETMLDSESGMVLENTLIGSAAFTIWDTYGVPIEEVEEIAKSKGIAIDHQGFQDAMNSQRELARNANKTKIKKDSKVFQYDQINSEPVNFIGYSEMSGKSVVIAILDEKGQPLKKAKKDEVIEIILKTTPFYAESGGQLGDKGWIFNEKCNIYIEDTQSPIEGLIVHHGIVKSGSIKVEDEIQTSVDTTYRQALSRSHSATHLIHAALRNFLGSHVRQAGSLVAPDRMRFDFTHPKSLDSQEIHAIQSLVNVQILNDSTILKTHSSYAEALNEGALAFFGDKYGSLVQIIEMGVTNTEIESKESFSKEVCGGTHANRTGELGLIYISSESSIGSGVRRLEATTGLAALENINDLNNTISAISNKLDTSPNNILQRIDAIQEELENEKDKTSTLNSILSIQQAEKLLKNIELIGEIKTISAEIQATNSEDLRALGDKLRDHIISGIIVLGCNNNNSALLIVMITNDLVQQGFNAVNLIKEGAKSINGGGGGKPELAQAGGKNPEMLPEAINSIRKLIKTLQK
tara:strand:- start:61072 stop:63795 length:2724 start_codon:yes stop_codon:yes gene_type:complete